jgi:hypothetical protein
MELSLPARPWQDLVLVQGPSSESDDSEDEIAAARSSGARLPHGVAEWSLALWAYGFVVVLLLGATHGVIFVGLRLVDQLPMPWGDWVLLAISLAFFSYVEGYRGFFLNWSPWVVRRSLLLPQLVWPARTRGCSCGRVLAALLGPLFAMGFFCASRRRLLISLVLYPGIVGLVVAVRALPSPYHEITDLGVAAGIGLGTLSLVHCFVKAVSHGRLPKDVDSTEQSGEAYNALLA